MAPAMTTNSTTPMLIAVQMLLASEDSFMPNARATENIKKKMIRADRGSSPRWGKKILKLTKSRLKLFQFLASLAE